MKVEYWIDNVGYYTEESNINGTIFQICEKHKKYIPCFCYHESLSIAGNCRMCLVEVSNSVKLVASCAKPMEKNVKIWLSSKRVERTREAILEFLLINHPLDCPICDQGGECDLQDITLVFGSDRGRYYEHIKRAVYDRECGSLVKMVLTRCIHCTRCVRFLSEIGDERELGMLGRGELSEIGTFVKRAVVSELAGNIIDLCPVGALTSRPYAFTARPWELNMVESIDMLDSSLSSIRIEYLNNRVYRILPIYSKSVNKDWISNTARFCYDSHIRQRLLYPSYRGILNDKFIYISWKKAFEIYFASIKLYGIKANLDFIIGDFLDLDALYYLNCFVSEIGAVPIIDKIDYCSDFRIDFFMDLNLMDQMSIIVLCGVRFRVEIPVLFARIKKIIKQFRIKVFSIGYNDDVRNVKMIGLLSDSSYYIEGKNKLFKTFYLNIIDKVWNYYFKRNILFFLSSNSFSDNKSYFSFKFYINRILKGFVYRFFRNITELNVMESGFKFKNNINFSVPSLLTLVNWDKKDISGLINKHSMVVYLGSFFDKGASAANLLLPVTMWFESEGCLYNNEGLLRKYVKAVSPSNNVIDLKELLMALIVYRNNVLKTRFSIVKNFDYFFKNFKFLKKLSKYTYSNKVKIIIKSENDNIGSLLIVNNLWQTSIFNVYNFDVVTRNSINLHLASIEYLSKLKSFL